MVSILRNLTVRSNTSQQQVDYGYVPWHRSLPSKFDSQILNYQNQGPLHELRNRVGQAFEDKKVSFLYFFTRTKKPSTKKHEGKEHVLSYGRLGDYIIKAQRTDLAVAPDANIYRVRKARRIQTIIDREGWQRLVTVPRKYLFYQAKWDKWLVVAKKLSLQKNVSAYNIRITADQAKAVASIALETGMTDLHGENIMQDIDGRIAIIDTEPVARKLIKKLKSEWYYKLGFLDISAVKLFLALDGVEMLEKFSTTHVQPDHRLRIQKTIRDVRGKYVVYEIAKLVAKIFVCFAAYTTVGLIPLSVISVPLKTVFGLQIIAKMMVSAALLYRM